MQFDLDNFLLILKKKQSNSYRIIYIELRQRVCQHIRDDAESILSLCDKMDETRNWRPPMNKNILKMNLASDEIDDTYNVRANYL